MAELKKQEGYIPTLGESLKIIYYIPIAHGLFFQFNLLHGCRPNEVLVLQADDFDFTKQEVTIQRGMSDNEVHDGRKNYDRNTIPILQELT